MDREGLTVQCTIRTFASCLGVSVLLLATSGQTPAAAKRITGQLSKPGYTVLAVAKNGGSRSDRARKGQFKVKAPSDRVTLHLVARDGTYAGPIVVDRERRGKRAIVGVVAGANLGMVKVKAGDGYAKVKRLRKRWIDDKSWARAKAGVPIGAGVFGRVRSKRTRGGAPGDRDIDAVPETLDIDDDGDLLLDNFERSGARGAARAAASELPGDPLYLSTGLLQIRLDETVNANAGALDVADIDQRLKTYGRISIAVAWPHNSAELDCLGGPVDPDDPYAGWIGGHSYCTPGGSGTWFWPPGPQQNLDFPECCDEDRNGFGTFGPGLELPGFQFLHHAASRDPNLPPEEQPGTIGTGDIFTECFPRCRSGQPEATGILGAVFATVPALVSYHDTAGNCARVSGMDEPGMAGRNCATVFSYPVPPPGSDCSKPGCPGGLGTEGNGFPVGAPTGKDIEVTLTFWRPQRRPIAPETAQWVDIGGLNYQPAFGCDADGCGNKYCPPTQDAFSVPPGSELSLTTVRRGEGALKDSAPDRPARPQNIFTFTVNLSECLRDPRGFEAPATVTWDPGQERQMVFLGNNQLDGSEQVFYFRRSG